MARRIRPQDVPSADSGSGQYPEVLPVEKAALKDSAEKLIAEQHRQVAGIVYRNTCSTEH